MYTPLRRSSSRALAAVLLLGTLAACSDDAGGADDSTVRTEPAEQPADTQAPDTAGSAVPDTAGSEVPDTASERADTGPEDEPVEPGAQALEIDVSASPYISLAAELTVSAPEAVQLDVVATSGDHVVELPLTADAATDHVIPLVGMRADRTYDIDVSALGPDGEEVATGSASFDTGSVPAEFLDYSFEVDPERSSPGVTIVEVTPQEGTPYLVAVDDEGETVWYYQNTGTVGGVEPTAWGTLSSHYWPLGVRDMDLLGRVVGNWQFATTADDDTSVDAAEQEQVIDADLLEAFTAMTAGNPGDPDPLPVASPDVELTSFHHEAWPMENGNFLVLGTTIHPLTPDQRARFCPDDPTEFNVISDVVVEFEPSGRVVRTWDLWDAVDIEEAPGHELCADSGPFASENDRDWLHANAVVYDEERDVIIVSARHTNQVIALEHRDEEGAQSQVRWIFGEVGTMPVDGDLPYYQHAPEVQEDGAILLYDNGNDRPGTIVGDPENPMYSRAVLYEVDDRSDDPSEWTVTQRWEHRTEDVDGSPLYARFLGDADRLENGNILITHGGIDLGADLPDLPEDEAYQHAKIIEVDPADGDIVWELDMGTPAGPATVYRSERLPSLYFGPDWVTE